jgi:3-carboxy-cis,cis-muconate cycloisomerase
VDHVRDLVNAAGLQVNAPRMRANLEATAGLPQSERVTLLLARRVRRGKARALVEGAIQGSGASGRRLRGELVADPTVAAHPAAAELDEALAPARYLGATQVFIDRALAAYRSATQ